MVLLFDSNELFSEHLNPNAYQTPSSWVLYETNLHILRVMFFYLLSHYWLPKGVFLDNPPTPRQIIPPIHFKQHRYTAYLCISCGLWRFTNYSNILGVLFALLNKKQALLPWGPHSSCWKCLLHLKWLYQPRAWAVWEGLLQRKLQRILWNLRISKDSQSTKNYVAQAG